MTSYSKLEKTQQLTLVAISDYKAIQGFSHCMNPEEETAFSPKFMWAQEEENPKGSSIILHTGKQGKDSRDNLPKSEVMSEPISPKENLLRYMILSHPYVSIPFSAGKLSTKQMFIPSLTSPFPRLSTVGIWPDGSPVFPWENPRWMTNFPILYHHTIKRHVHGGVAHRAAGNGRVGRRGRKVLSGSQQLQRTLINLQGLFSP